MIGQNIAYRSLEKFRGNCVRVDYELSGRPDCNTRCWKLRNQTISLQETTETTAQTEFYPNEHRARM